MIASVTGHHDLEPRRRPLQILILAAPHQIGAGRKLDAGVHGLLGVGDVTADVAVPDIDIDVDRELAVLGPDRGRPARRRDFCHFPSGTAPPAGIGTRTSRAIVCGSLRRSRG
jgi:hypothetical protein